MVWLCTICFPYTRGIYSRTRWLYSDQVYLLTRRFSPTASRCNPSNSSNTKIAESFFHCKAEISGNLKKTRCRCESTLHLNINLTLLLSSLGISAHHDGRLTNPHRRLDGSCQCGGVEFTLQSQTPVPYQLCACSICRKVGGYGGSVNLGGIADSLKVRKGQDLIKYELPT